MTPAARLSVERWLEQSQPTRVGDYIEEWAGFGFREFAVYLARWAAFEDYLRRTGRHADR